MSLGTLALLALLSPAAAAPPLLAPDARGFTPDRAFDMERLRLALALDPEAGTVAGTATWTVRRLAAGPLVLDQIALTIEDVRAGDAPLKWRTAGDTLVIEVPGDTADVAVRYRATPRDGLHFRRPGAADTHGEVWSQGEGTDNRYWFPGWDHPNDRFVYEGAITAPAGWKVLTNSGHDLVNYLVMVAAGPYEVHGTDTISAWVPPGTSKGGVARVLDPIPGMMAHFAERTGVPYPWGSYRQVFVQRFLYTGMENTSATIEDRWMVGNDRVAGTRAPRIASVVAHELAHQWYGDLLTCRNWREMWLNEGFATFFAADWEASPLAGVSGADEWANGVFGRYRASLATEALAGRFHAGAGAPDSVNVYNKGASVLQMLRVMLGEDVFWAGIRRYTQGHQRALVDTQDFVDAMEDVSGQELGWFFQQWVDLPYVPELTVSSTYADGAVVVTVRQATGTERPVYTLPVEVEVGGPDGPVVAKGWLTDEDVELRVPLAAAPTYVAFDPRGGVLAKVTQTQDPAAWEAQARSSAPYARLLAIEALGDTPRSEVLAALAADTKTSVVMRRAAVRALGAQRAHVALLPLLDDPDDLVREAVAEALGASVGKAAAPALAERVARDPNPDVAALALTSLARLDGAAAAKLARTRLRPKALEDLKLMAAAAGVLGEHGAPADLAALLRIEGPERARLHALRAAARLASRQDPGLARDRLFRDVARATEDMLDDSDLRCREGAVAILAQVGDSATVSRLEALRRVETGRDLRTAAATAITTIRARATTPGATPNEMEARMEALEKRVDELLKDVEERH
ncbi:MAG: M1 family aminopeptidase [Myxococcota bacterium]